VVENRLTNGCADVCVCVFVFVCMYVFGKLKVGFWGKKKQNKGKEGWQIVDSHCIPLPT
jgi:hypothetical protein